MTGTKRDPVYVLEQYEALRREATAMWAAGMRGQGLAVLRSRGLPAWLAALSTFVSPPAPEPLASGRSLSDGPRLFSSARAELTTVLAGMVLVCAYEPEVP